MTSQSRGLRTRRSFGGRVVEDALEQVGFTMSPDVQIVETARPGRSRARAVLVQNAWNFIPDDEFKNLSRPYPDAMRRRMRQRRVLAALNTRRAARVVALTQTMADVVMQSTGRAVEVSEVLHPLGVLDPHDDADGLPPEPFVLVPGTITWYKDPLMALSLVAASPELPDRIVFAGEDDGSGCWPEVRRYASALGLRVTGGPVSRPVMRAALRRASSVFVTSRLESLGFSLTEALALAPGSVVASEIRVHEDLSQRIGRAPTWLGSTGTGTGTGDVPSPPDAVTLRASWVELGHCLDLARRAEEAV